MTQANNPNSQNSDLAAAFAQLSPERRERARKLVSRKAEAVEKLLLQLIKSDEKERSMRSARFDKENPRSFTHYEERDGMELLKTETIEREVAEFNARELASVNEKWDTRLRGVIKEQEADDLLVKENGSTAASPAGDAPNGPDAQSRDEKRKLAMKIAYRRYRVGHASISIAGLTEARLAQVQSVLDRKAEAVEELLKFQLKHCQDTRDKLAAPWLFTARPPLIPVLGRLTPWADLDFAMEKANSELATLYARQLEQVKHRFDLELHEIVVDQLRDNAHGVWLDIPNVLESAQPPLIQMSPTPEQGHDR